MRNTVRFNDHLVRGARKLCSAVRARTLGYNRGTNPRTMICDWYRYEPKVKRIIPGGNPGITVPVLKELY